MLRVPVFSRALEYTYTLSRKKARIVVQQQQQSESNGDATAALAELQELNDDDDHDQNSGTLGLVRYANQRNVVAVCTRRIFASAVPCYLLSQVQMDANSLAVFAQSPTFGWTRDIKDLTFANADAAACARWNTQMLPKLFQLRSLSLCFLEGRLAVDAIEAIATQPYLQAHLEVLQLETFLDVGGGGGSAVDADSTARRIAMLGELKNLVTLKINACDFTSDQIAQILLLPKASDDETAAAVVDVPRLPRLRTLVLRYAEIDGEFLRRFCDSEYKTQLVSLDVQDCSNLRGGIDCVAKLWRLEELNIVGTGRRAAAARGNFGAFGDEDEDEDEEHGGDDDGDDSDGDAKGSVGLDFSDMRRLSSITAQTLSIAELQTLHATGGAALKRLILQRGLSGVRTSADFEALFAKRPKQTALLVDVVLAHTKIGRGHEPEDFSALAVCAATVQSLDLSWSNVGAESLAFILRRVAASSSSAAATARPHLQTLNVSGAEMLEFKSSVWFAAVAAVSSLRELRAAALDLTTGWGGGEAQLRRCFVTIAQHGNLTSLDLSMKSIEGTPAENGGADDGAEAETASTTTVRGEVILRVIGETLSGCLQELDVSGNACVTDRSLRPLEQMARLLVLDFSEPYQPLLTEEFFLRIAADRARFPALCTLRGTHDGESAQALRTLAWARPWLAMPIAQNQGNLGDDAGDHDDDDGDDDYGHDEFAGFNEYDDDEDDDDN